MQTTMKSRPRIPVWASLVLLLFVYASWKAIPVSFGFQYSLLRDPFDLTKFLIDVAVWAVVYFAVHFVADRLWARRRAAGR